MSLRCIQKNNRCLWLQRLFACNVNFRKNGQSNLASQGCTAVSTVVSMCTQSNIYFLGSTPKSKSQKASGSFQLFLHSSRQTVPILYNGRSFPKNCPFPRGSESPSNINIIRWAHLSPQTKHGTSIGSAVFAGLTTVTRVVNFPEI